MADPKTFEARVAAATSLRPAAPVAPTPAAKPVAEAPANDAAPAEAGDGHEPASDAEPAPAAAAPESAETSTEYADAEARLDAIAQALEKGDLVAAAKASGRQIKLKDATAKAFTALSKREAKHREKVQADLAKLEKKSAAITKAQGEIATESQRVSALLRHAEQEHGWIPRVAKAWEARDLVTVAKGIERLCKGASLAQITQAMANMHLGKAEPKSAAETAAEEERAALQREREAFARQKAEEKAAAEKAKNQLTEAQKRSAAVTKFGESWKSHPLLQNPDDPDAPDPDELERAFAAFEAAWKEDRSVKPKKVLDELWAKEQRRLRRLGLTPAAAPSAAPAPKAGASNGKAAPAGKAPAPKPRLPEPPRTTGKSPTRDETREARIAAARRATEQQMRGLRI